MRCCFGWPPSWREPGDEQVYRIGGDEFAALLPWEQAEVECRLTHLLGRVKALKWREFADAITLSAGGRAIRMMP